MDFLLSLLSTLFHEHSTPRATKPVKQLSTRPGQPCHLPCDSNLAIVCDQFGNLYQNGCVFNVERCKNPALEYNPNTCGTDSSGLSIRPADPGPPVNLAPQPGCDKFNCGGNVDPICDNRGATYQNKCAFDRFKCMYPSLKLSTIPCADWQIKQAQS